MNDIVGFGVWLLSGIGQFLAILILIPWSIIIAIKEKRLGDYFYQFARGKDIMLNKACEPVFNKKLRKPEGKKFGGDVPISYDMAVNKTTNTQTKEADWVEKNILNRFQKDHLYKTLEEYKNKTDNI